jgi:hypothetical protein
MRAGDHSHVIFTTGRVKRTSLPDILELYKSVNIIQLVNSLIKYIYVEIIFIVNFYMVHIIIKLEFAVILLNNSTLQYEWRN